MNEVSPSPRSRGEGRGEVPDLLTFPARPVNGGHLKHALPKRGEWYFEPKYNGWRAMVHCPSRTMWNRHGELLSIANEFRAALDILKKSPFVWLDVEALERRHNLGRGSLIVLDCPCGIWSEPVSTSARADYRERGGQLFKGIGNPLFVAEPGRWNVLQAKKPEPDQVYMTQAFTATDLPALWTLLPEINKYWGCDFYEGVVAKRADSIYPIQLNNPGQVTPTWMKHRFIK